MADVVPPRDLTVFIALQQYLKYVMTNYFLLSVQWLQPTIQALIP